MKNFDTFNTENKDYLLKALVKMIRNKMMKKELENRGQQRTLDDLDHLFTSDDLNDGEYLHLLQVILDKDVYKKLCIDLTEKILKEAEITLNSSLKGFKPEFNEIEKFCQQERKRLKEIVPLEKIGIEEDSRIFQKRLEEISEEKKRLEIKRKVDVLIKVHGSHEEPQKPPQLTLEKFSWLFKEYNNEAFILKLRPIDDANKKIIRARLKIVEDLIDKNKDSLVLPKDIRDNPELRLDVLKLLYATCYTGDYKTFKTLFNKLGDENLQTMLFSSMPIFKETKEGKGLMSLEGLTNIICKRIAIEEEKNPPNQKRILEWANVTVEMERLLNGLIKKTRSSKGLDGLSPAERLAGLSLAEDDGGPAARSTKPRNPAQQVVESGAAKGKDGGPR